MCPGTIKTRIRAHELTVGTPGAGLTFVLANERDTQWGCELLVVSRMAAPLD